MNISNFNETFLFEISILPRFLIKAATLLKFYRAIDVGTHSLWKELVRRSSNMKAFLLQTSFKQTLVKNSISNNINNAFPSL